MEWRTPDYFSSFRCLASDCPHSCCIGWEVTVDAETAAFYQTVSGPLGEKLRRHLTEEDGEFFLPLHGGRCPFLDSQNLCEIHCRLGEEHTSVTCRSHPRFIEEYGSLREISLAASCPAANALLLGSQAPLTFPVCVTEETPSFPPDAWLTPLLFCRDRAMQILQDRTRPLRSRMVWLLLFSNEVQILLDEDRAEELTGLCEACGGLPDGLPEGLPAAGPGLFPRALEILAEREPLEPDWPSLLKAAQASPEDILCPDWAGERILAYFVFRYFLKAVGDGDLLSRAELAVFSLLVIDRLSSALGLAEALRRYCREIEHCPENLVALQQAFCEDADLSLSHFFRELNRTEPH